MRVLNRKLWRDLWEMKAQALAIIAVDRTPRTLTSFTDWESAELGSRKETARMLGITTRTLSNKLRTYRLMGIAVPAGRPAHGGDQAGRVRRLRLLRRRPVHDPGVPPGEPRGSKSSENHMVSQ